MDLFVRPGDTWWHLMGGHPSPAQALWRFSSAGGGLREALCKPAGESPLTCPGRGIGLCGASVSISTEWFHLPTRSTLGLETRARPHFESLLSNTHFSSS